MAAPDYRVGSMNMPSLAKTTRSIEPSGNKKNSHFEPRDGDADRYRCSAWSRRSSKPQGYNAIHTSLTNDATQSELELLKLWPDAKCASGDGGALESLRPATRKAWLAMNPLPGDVPYYSLVTYPRPDRISSILSSSYHKLSRVDARNDGQVLFYDQVIPGSTLIAYVNADHWALAVPVARTHATIGSMFVDQNDYPREALLEALLRFIEEELDGSPRSQ